jgi:hypothetical protein
MILHMVLERIDIAPAGFATEFSHGLQDIRVNPRPLIWLGFSGANF